MNISTSLKRKRGDVEDRSLDASDSEEEYDFENIDLDGTVLSQGALTTSSAESVLSVHLQTEPDRAVARRHPTTAIARKIRLEIHKLHLLCLLSHISIRNSWCSDVHLHGSFSRLKQTFKGNVHPKPTSAQIQRTRVLLEGLESLSVLWSKAFRITSRGMSKPKWYVDDDLSKVLNSSVDVGTPIHKEDFMSGGRTLEGDRDMGAQLFVGFLRFMGLRARLICSLQPLALNVGKGNLASITEPVLNPPDGVEHVPQTKVQVAASPRRLTKPTLGHLNRGPPKKKIDPRIKVATPILECSYPIYWAEVFDVAAQKWYPVDPLVTGTVNKPAAFEPPLSESQNTLSYVVAIEQDGSARDVTYRYTKQYNAKVRRSRLESISSNGASWWKRLMRLYAPRIQQDVHRIEDAEFAQKELNEGIPANISDLKNHPVFVLERHLRKEEIIFPKRDCGTVTVGKTRPAIVEKVYPRKFVIKLRSSQAWYTRGRQVMIGEQPLKCVKRKNPVRNTDGDNSQQEPDEETENLFSEAQTMQYIPFPVVDGKIPKNAYGNIDLFTPTMLPPGSIHHPYRDSEKCARLLGIDFANAVTGFDYSSRQVVPVKTGVVVVEEAKEAMDAILQALSDQASESIEQTKALRALQRWSHFLRSLRIRDHVQNRYGGDNDHLPIEGSSATKQDTNGENDTMGGFV